MQAQLFNMAQTQLLEAQSRASQARLDNTTGTLNGKNRDDLRKVAEDFEAVFIAQMMKPMFDTVPRDGVMSGGAAEEIYQSMMVEEVGKSIARNGGIGIADNVYRELLKLQEQ